MINGDNFGWMIMNDSTATGGLGSRHHPFGRRGIVLCPGQGWIYAEEAGKSEWLHPGEPCQQRDKWGYPNRWMVFVKDNPSIDGWGVRLWLRKSRSAHQQDLYRRLHTYASVISDLFVMCNVYSLNIHDKMLCPVCHVRNIYIYIYIEIDR